MKLAERVGLAVAVVLLDFIVFILPVAALAFAYILMARPIWFHDFIQRLYAPDKRG